MLCNPLLVVGTHRRELVDPVCKLHGGKLLGLLLDFQLLTDLIDFVLAGREQASKALDELRQGLQLWPICAVCAKPNAFSMLQ